MDSAAKIIAIFVALCLACWIFRSIILVLLYLCFWIIRGVVFLALMLLISHMLIKFFFSFDLLRFIKALLY